MSDIYIGFSRLSEFIAALNPLSAVYLAPLTLVKSNDYYSTVTTSLVASQPQAGCLIYCKIDYSRWQEVYGRPFGGSDTERADSAPRLQRQMWEFIVEQLRASNGNMVLLDGAPSFPRDILLIPGNIEGITYDADLNEFVRTAPTSPLGEVAEDEYESDLSDIRLTEAETAAEKAHEREVDQKRIEYEFKEFLSRDAEGDNDGVTRDANGSINCISNSEYIGDGE